MTAPRCPAPACLAADHRARGVITIERYAAYLRGARRGPARTATGSWPPPNRWPTWPRPGPSAPAQRTYLSLNRTGLAGSAFELDDRLVTTWRRPPPTGWTGIKHMTRIDLTDPAHGRAPSSCWAGCSRRPGRAGLEALIESVSWRDGAMARDTDAIVYAAVIAHDMGAPLLKVPVPDVPAGGRPASRRWPGWWPASGCPCSSSVGPSRRRRARAGCSTRCATSWPAGRPGMAIGRAVYQDPDPAAHGRRRWPSVGATAR